jgi:hypothetical protein
VRPGVAPDESRRGLAVVSAEAEGVTGWVEKHPDVLLRLVRSHRCSKGNGLGDRGVEVADLEVEVHHRTLLPVDWRQGVCPQSARRTATG